LVALHSRDGNAISPEQIDALAEAARAFGTLARARLDLLDAQDALVASQGLRGWSRELIAFGRQTYRLRTALLELTKQRDEEARWWSTHPSSARPTSEQERLFAAISEWIDIEGSWRTSFRSALVAEDEERS
jgi:hypothetical protein